MEQEEEDQEDQEFDYAADDDELEESMNDYMHMQPSASHGSSAAAAAPLLLDAFLTSCRADTWDSKTQCIICLECLGAATAGLLEGQDDIISYIVTVK
ncbi:hypothetical protein ACLOJK_025715 [Asimina triloba]